ncbi:MAG: glycosyl transferase, partial [Acidobacteriota bacterium]|nr:glycosyl transferase [Acidobacteriota bacterium]
IGYMVRLRRHVPASEAELDSMFEESLPSLTLLIPSYREEARIVRQSLWSASLQEYPGKRVVLLIDDPPNPGTPADLQTLRASRSLPAEIEAALREPRQRSREALAAFESRVSGGPFFPAGELEHLRRTILDVADWLSERARCHEFTDHTDELFVEQTFHEPAATLLARADALESAVALTEHGTRMEYRRLAARFDAELSAFERKRYANLSHEPNKAMNLNSYIGLLGRRLREVERGAGLWLEPAESGDADFEVPDSDYLVTLDADSVLTPDYALRLVHVMKQPGNERLGVAQTPYTAFPGASIPIERAAGATTDMQYIVHQGFTLFDATYWVGANALLRTAALREIATTRMEGDTEITCFISDRTVIEDTESSVDMIHCGWSLYNYPRRLSHSATPDDFGSLLVQRRRWANGGLIILPKLLRHLMRGPARLKKAGEGYMRVYYLTSIAAVNMAVPLLLIYPFEENLRSVWLPLTALPYFYFYGRDMVLAGYRWADLLRVYALNLMLIPINLGGVFKSIEQGITGKRVPFRRTPKSREGTSAPLVYLAAQHLAIAWCAIIFVADALSGRWLHGIFTLFNGAFFAYALTRFVLRPKTTREIARSTAQARSSAPTLG